jgi:hypothetical protein
MPWAYIPSLSTFAGNDFSIDPTTSAGGGVLISVTAPMTWVVAGTDQGTSTYSFSENFDRSNYSWISMPYSSGYMTAGDVVLGMSTTAGTKAKALGIWQGAFQSSVPYIYIGSPINGFVGTNFDLIPGQSLLQFRIHSN